MEELQSTEALEKEILEDARKKAFKILKSAGDSVAASRLNWEQKLQDTLEKTRAGYDEKKQHVRQEIMARLPVDKRRIRSKKIESFLHRAMLDFINALDRPRLLDILEAELSSRIEDALPEDIREEEGQLRYRGLSSAELSRLVQKNLARFSLHIMEDPLYTVAGSFPALVLDFKRLRITASVDLAAETLLLEKRMELAGALLGENAHD
ncbi:MAG: ATPase [Spirochaetaceae bacterium]|jgi:hypothetical protein|nr:ATPase [Spirochaetaceae bacterium]